MLLPEELLRDCPDGVFLGTSFWGQKVGFKFQNGAVFQRYVNDIQGLLRSDPTAENMAWVMRSHPFD